MSVVADTKILGNKVKSLNEQVDIIYEKVDSIQASVDQILSNAWKGSDNKTFNLKMNE